MSWDTPGPSRARRNWLRLPKCAAAEVGGITWDLARSLEKFVRISANGFDEEEGVLVSVYCSTLLSIRPNTRAMRCDRGVA